MKRRSVAIALLIGLATICATAVAQQWQNFYQSQVADYWAAMLDPSKRFRLQEVWMELAEYTGRPCPVFPYQTGSAGQALPNGAIVIDISIIGNPNKSVVAFWLAHEWGHQMMGHPLSAFTPVGQFKMMMGDKSDEDNADRWAAKFLRDSGYDIGPVLGFLRSIPPSGPGDRHSTGMQRAQIVRAVFDGDEDFDPGSGPATSVVPCQHTAHSEGDLIPCQHGTAHPFDLVPCSHPVPTPYGLRPYHTADQVPCSHPVHPGGDIIPCAHPMHPNGDIVPR